MASYSDAFVSQAALTGEGVCKLLHPGRRPRCQNREGNIEAEVTEMLRLRVRTKSSHRCEREKGGRKEPG